MASPCMPPASSLSAHAPVFCPNRADAAHASAVFSDGVYVPASAGDLQPVPDVSDSAHLIARVTEAPDGFLPTTTAPLAPTLSPPLSGALDLEPITRGTQDMEVELPTYPSQPSAGVCDSSASQSGYSSQPLNANFTWDQSEDTVDIYIPLPDVAKSSQMSIKFQALHICAVHNQRVLVSGPLTFHIDPDESHWTISRSSGDVILELHLQKCAYGGIYYTWKRIFDIEADEG